MKRENATVKVAELLAAADFISWVSSEHLFTMSSNATSFWVGVLGVC